MEKWLALLACGVALLFAAHCQSGEADDADMGSPGSLAGSPCDEHGTARACSIDGGAEGMQFCAVIDELGTLKWGGCLMSWECLPQEPADRCADGCQLVGDTPVCLLGGDDG